MIVLCRSSLIPHQATMDSKSGMQFSDSLYYYALYSNMVIQEELIVSYSWYQSLPWIRIITYGIGIFYFLGFIQIRFLSSFRNFLQIKTRILLHIWNLLVKTRRSVGGTSPEEARRALTRRHTPPRALSTAALEGHAPDLNPNWFADVMLTSA